MLAAAAEPVLSLSFVYSIIPLSCLLGIAFAVLLYIRVSKVRVGGTHGVRSENGREYLLEEEQ